MNSAEPEWCQLRIIFVTGFYYRMTLFSPLLTGGVKEQKSQETKKTTVLFPLTIREPPWAGFEHSKTGPCLSWTLP